MILPEEKRLTRAPDFRGSEQIFLTTVQKKTAMYVWLRLLFLARRRARAVLTGEQGWAGRYSSSRRSLLPVSELQGFLTGHRIEGALLQLRESNRVSQPSWPLLGLSLYFYHVRELLVCWLFFSLLFALPVLVILLGVLAWHAAKRATDWAGTAGPTNLLAKMKF